MVTAPWHTLSRTLCEAGVCSRCCLCSTLIALAHFSGPCGQVQQMLIPLQHAGILPNCVFWSLSGRRAGEIMSQEQLSACEAWQLQQIPQLPCHSSEAVLDPLSESLVELSTRCPPDNLFITTLCTSPSLSCLTCLSPLHVCKDHLPNACIQILVPLVAFVEMQPRTVLMSPLHT